MGTGFPHGVRGPMQWGFLHPDTDFGFIQACYKQSVSTAAFNTQKTQFCQMQIPLQH